MSLQHIEPKEKKVKYAENWRPGQVEEEGHIYNVKKSNWGLGELQRRKEAKPPYKADNIIKKWGLRVREFPTFDYEKFDYFLGNMDMQFKPRLPKGFGKGLPFFQIFNFKMLIVHGKRVGLTTRAVVVLTKYAGGKLYFFTIPRNIYNMYKRNAEESDVYRLIFEAIKNETERKYYKIKLIKERFIMDFQEKKLYKLYGGRGQDNILKHLRRGN